MPQDAGFILYDTDVSGDVAGIIFDEWTARVVPWLLEHSSELKKSSEAPITLFLGKTMVCGMVSKKRRIMNIPHH
jgi:hypothetical protein